ncbi:TPA: degT/DnrJ/EryC1/StrS aminotransferase [Staphylococcus aureus]|nr:degT/DnrJ/EryC1/StrS aminotransferase [Staphylococcus aureus]
MTNLKNDYYNLSFILSRVLNTGTIMSIEKNEKELPGLENKVKKLTKKKYASTFNSYTGALHAAAISYSSGFGDALNIANTTDKETKFLKWLGIKISNTPEYLERLHLNFENLNDIISPKIQDYETFILDFTGLGFGPAAVIITDNKIVYGKAEKLKIFGSYDLRTMWTQERDASSIEPAIQFNYRLSPLVAACLKLSLIKGVN